MNKDRETYIEKSPLKALFLLDKTFINLGNKPKMVHRDEGRSREYQKPF